MKYDNIASTYLKLLQEQQLELDFNAPEKHPMIDVDGVMKHRNNSEGKSIHPTDEGIRNFHRWFGNSTTVDEHGRPKIFYHGTASTENDSGNEAVSQFNPYYNLKSKQLYGAGVYTTENPDIASEYSDAYREHSKNTHPNVLPLYVKAEHPLDINAPIHKSLQHLQKVKGAKTPGGKVKQYIDEYARAGVLPLLNHLSHAYENDTGRYADFDKYQDYAKNTAIDAINEKVRKGEIKTGNDLFNLHAKTYYHGLNETGTHNASTRALRMLGFDSIKHIGGRNLGTIDHPVVIALDSANVKSALGNKGTFDPRKNELNESIEHPMIDVDGQLKHRTNSEGKPIHPTDEGIRNFHRWFGDSHVVDKYGRPLVVYHKTNSDIKEFDPTKISDGFGFYFALSKAGANRAASGKKNLISSYIKATNIAGTKESPAADWLQMRFDGMGKNLVDAGHDAAFIRDEARGSIVVRHPHQIKSIDNSGSFDHPTKITESKEHPMIDVDGVMKHRHNSENRPIHPTDEGIRNFHRWFGESKSVDKHGRPKVFYRMTDSDRTEFRKSWRGGLIYFAATPTGAENASRAGNSVTYPVYLKTNKIRGDKGPGVFYADAEAKGYENKLKIGDYDAVKVRDEASRHGGTIAVLDPSQIKSALGNNGDFSNKKNTIHEAYLNVR